MTLEQTTTASPSIRGLTAGEVVERRARGLGNNVALHTGRSYFQILRENVFTFINNVLFALGIALVVLGRYTDAVVSVAVVAINVVVSIVQEIRAKRTLDRIALLTRPRATVIRDGQAQEIDPNEIVVGDVLVVNAGDQIVVDGQVAGGGKMDVDESLLTGESDHIAKRAGDPVFSGSFCVTGSALYVAEKVGAQSVANQLTAGARAFRRIYTPLQREINLMLRVLVLLVVYFEILMVINAVLSEVPLVESVKMSVVIAGLVPNGLLLATAVAYAVGAVRMVRQGALVQQSNAVESLSNVDVLCLDKTGTLTANAIKFHAIRPLGSWSEQELRRILGDYAHSSTAANRTSEALAEACAGQRRRVVDEVPFSSARKWSALAIDDPDRHGVFVLGAPEMLRPYLPADLDLSALSHDWTEQGLRVVLFAHAPEPTSLHEADEQPRLPASLTPVALVAFSDQLRAEARETLSGFAQAGIQLKIISGDNPDTVAALARQAGLGPDIRLVSGGELAEMDEAQFAAAADGSTIFGRITPQQKEKLVAALRERGHYVAMIGDGVNDVLSLKQAHLGVAMQSGSQATRGVADIVLLNDSFAALPKALLEGQRIINGMQDILKLFMTRVLYVALLILSAGIVGGFPFSPKHSSLLALLTVGVPTIALAAWARPGAQPRRSLTRALLHFVLPAALTLALAGLAVYLTSLLIAYADIQQANPDIADQTAIEQALLVAQTALTVFSIFCGLLLLPFAEPPTRFWVAGDVLSGDWRPTFLALGLLAAFVVVLALPMARSFFDLTALHPLTIVVLALAALLWGCLIRFTWRRRLLDRFLSADLGFRPD